MGKYRSVNRCLAGMIAVFLGAVAPATLPAQPKPLVKVVAGYGSTDGAIAPERLRAP